MFAKFGFLILLLAFGGLALLSGLRMPAKFQAKFPGFEALKAKILPAAKVAKAPAAASTPSAASAPAAALLLDTTQQTMGLK